MAKLTGAYLTVWADEPAVDIGGLSIAGDGPEMINGLGIYRLTTAPQAGAILHARMLAAIKWSMNFTDGIDLIVMAGRKGRRDDFENGTQMLRLNNCRLHRSWFRRMVATHREEVELVSHYIHVLGDLEFFHAAWDDDCWGLRTGGIGIRSSLDRH